TDCVKAIVLGPDGSCPSPPGQVESWRPHSFANGRGGPGGVPSPLVISCPGSALAWATCGGRWRRRPRVQFLPQLPQEVYEVFHLLHGLGSVPHVGIEE